MCIHTYLLATETSFQLLETFCSECPLNTAIENVNHLSVE